jgi:hypothetical protein
MESNHHHQDSDSEDESHYDVVLSGNHTLHDLKELAHGNFHTPVASQLALLDLYMARKDLPRELIYYLSNMFRPLSHSDVNLKVETTLFEPTPKYVSTNSSILLDKEHDQLIVNVRLVDYMIYPDGSYNHGKEKNTINTSNIFKYFKLHNGEVTSDTFLDCETHHWGEDIDVGNNIKGMEDVRISFNEDGKMLILATVQHQDKLNIGCLDKDTKTLKVYRSERCEKNWAPINKTSLVVKHWYPFTLFDLRDKKETVFPEFDFDFRGSSQFVHLPPQWIGAHYLGIVHQVFFKDHQRYYLHRFAVLNEQMKPVGLSRLFYFVNQPVEYNCGIAIVGSRVYIPVSARDCNSTLFSAPLIEIMNMIRPIDLYLKRTIPK